MQVSFLVATEKLPYSADCISTNSLLVFGGHIPVATKLGDLAGPKIITNAQTLAILIVTYSESNHFNLHFVRDVMPDQQWIRFFMKRPAAPPAFCPRFLLPEPNKSKLNTGFHEKSEALLIKDKIHSTINVTSRSPHRSSVKGGGDL